MLRRTIAALMAVGALTAATAVAQTVPTPTQPSVDPTRGPTAPLVVVTVVGRTTAINYRPRRGDTTVNLQGLRDACIRLTTTLWTLLDPARTVGREEGCLAIS